MRSISNDTSRNKSEINAWALFKSIEISKQKLLFKDKL